MGVGFTEITVGWDCEYYTKDDGKLTVISHQLYIYELGKGIFIDCLEDGHLPKLKDIYRTIVNKCPKDQNIKSINLIAYKSRDVFSALADGRQSAYESKLICYGSTVFGDDKFIDDDRRQEINVWIYDIQRHQEMSLNEAGKLLNIPIVDINEYRGSRYELYKHNKEVYFDYAMSKARLITEMFMKSQEFMHKEFGLTKLPKTVGMTGALLLKQEIDKDPRPNGYEIKSQKRYNKITKRNENRNIFRAIDEIQKDFESIYFGGRIELYSVGLNTGCEVFDYDMINAYVTAQSTIPQFDFDNPIYFDDHEECFKYLLEHPFSYGVCKFRKLSHKPGIKYPVLVQRDYDENATIFTLSAINYQLSSFEFMVAYHDFDQIIGFDAVIYRSIENPSSIGQFQCEIRRKRQRYKKQGEEYYSKYLKQLGNTTYGKIAQGLNDKTVIDLKNTTSGELAKKKMQKSPITNLFFATNITALVRAIAYETINEIDRLGIEVLYFSTDGFATVGIVPDKILRGEFGIITHHVSEHIERLFGKREFYELKNAGRGWLSIKPNVYTNLQVMDEYNQINVISGVQVPKSIKKTEFIYNEWIALTRFKDTKYEEIYKTSAQEWLKGNEYRIIKKEKAFNWDYDFKRKPDESTLYEVYGRVCFRTIPFQDVKEFISYKESYQNFKRGFRVEGKQVGIKNKILTANHMNEFLSYINSKELGLNINITKNLHLKLLANFIYFNSNNKIGKKMIGKLLHQPVSTVQNWIKEEIRLIYNSKFLKYLIREFNLSDFFSEKFILEFENITSSSQNNKYQLQTFIKNKLGSPASYINWEKRDTYEYQAYKYIIEYISDIKGDLCI